MIFPIVHGLTEVCTKMKNKKTFHPRVQIIINNLLTAMANKNSWGNIYHSKILAKCTFRFKNILFSTNPSKSNLIEIIKNEITDHVTTIIQTSRTLNHEDNINQYEKQNKEHNIINQDNEFSIWGSLDLQVNKSKPINTSRSKAILEIQNYLDGALVPRHTDPLEWWKQNYYNFLNLSNLARRMLCCQTTSVPCKRIFF